MPPCRNSPWCECGTRFDGKTIIFCDKHPPLQQGETEFAAEIYVNGQRWFPQDSREDGVSHRTPSQEAENDLAERIWHTTAQPLDNTIHINGDRMQTVEQTTEEPDSLEKDGRDTTRISVDVMDADMGDIPVHEDFLHPDTEVPSDVEWGDNGEDFAFNKNRYEEDLDVYDTPPSSPAEAITFFGNETSKAEIDEFVRRLPPNVLGTDSDDEDGEQDEVIFAPTPSPFVANGLVTQVTGKYILKQYSYTCVLD